MLLLPDVAVTALVPVADTVLSGSVVLAPVGENVSPAGAMTWIVSLPGATPVKL